MEPKTRRRLGAVTMAGIGVIHLVLAPEYFEEQAYLGALFVLGAAAAAAVTLRLWYSEKVVTWFTGSLIALGMGVGFVLSRTVGLPGFHESEWEASGILSLLLEAGFLAAALSALSAGAPHESPVSSGRA